MHPLIARYLDLQHAVTTLEKQAAGAALEPMERAFVAQADREPKMKKAVLDAKGRSKPSNQVQQQAIVLAVRAATAEVLEDAALGPKAKAALGALEAEGATADEAFALVSGVLLEESFGYAEDPAHFDAAYVAETYESFPALAKLNEDLVDEWLEAWAKAGNGDDKALRLSVAETLLDVAWNEGPQPITPEHLDDAVEALSASVAESEFVNAMKTLEAFLTFLQGKQIVGPERGKRLIALLSAAAANARGEVEDEASDEDEDDEPVEER